MMKAQLIKLKICFNNFMNIVVHKVWYAFDDPQYDDGGLLYLDTK